MRILVWGINYAPEVTGIAPYNTALCEFLHGRGHRVQMLTSFPYYPAWQKLPEDAGEYYRCDNFDGVTVHRCWHYVPRAPSALKRVFHEASFVLISLLRGLTLDRPDVVIVVSPPLLLGAAAWILTRIKRTRFVFHVQDLQPDAAVELGMMRRSLLVRALYGLESFAYRSAAVVSTISTGLVERIKSKGIPREKLILFPNGVTIPSSLPASGEFRRRQRFGNDEFLAIYSGNLGVKQGLGILVEAAKQIRNPKLKIIICGDGGQRDVLAEAIQRAGLKNVMMLPLQSEKHYLEMLADADVTVITQQKGAASCFFPSKIFKSLALGRPVVMVCNEVSDLAAFNRKAGVGVVVPPGDAALLASQLDALSGNPAQLAQYSRAAKTAAKNFDQETIHRQFERELVALLEKRTACVASAQPS